MNSNLSTPRPDKKSQAVFCGLFKLWFTPWISVLLLTAALQGQTPSTYLKNGIVVARFPMHFTNGYMFITVPVIDTDVYGKALTLNRSFILDPTASNDGSFMPDDSLVNVTGTRTFYFPVSKQRTLTADLVPTLAKGIYKQSDTSFYGVLGYAFIRKYVTIINFFERTVTFYSARESEPTWDPRLDTAAIFVPYLDDAILNHCNCAFPTMWFEVKAPPLKEGRVHFALAERQSVIFKEALEPKTQKYIDNEMRKDSIAGKKENLGGITIQTFELGGFNIADRSPRRTIADLPPIFRNLNIFITGTVAIDVLRHFHAVIIDPTRSRVMLVK
jgi:hypothetical protein